MTEVVVGTVRFQFDRDVSLDSVEMTLHLAMISAEGLIGRARVRLGLQYVRNDQHQEIVLQGNRSTLRVVARIFTALLLREHGEDAFHVERLHRRPELQGAAA
jgi:hypothetical protein